MTLPMSWGEWAQHDGTALAVRTRKSELTDTELAAQAAAGIAKVDPALSGVVEVFEDVVVDPAKDGANLEGPFAGLPDTAAFVDACRGPAPGEFMPFWTSPEPYTQLFMHDPPARSECRAVALGGGAPDHREVRRRSAGNLQEAPSAPKLRLLPLELPLCSSLLHS